MSSPSLSYASTDLRAECFNFFSTVCSAWIVSSHGKTHIINIWQLLLSLSKLLKFGTQHKLGLEVSLPVRSFLTSLAHRPWSWQAAGGSSARLRRGSHRRRRVQRAGRRRSRTGRQCQRHQEPPWWRDGQSECPHPHCQWMLPTHAGAEQVPIQQSSQRQVASWKEKTPCWIPPVQLVLPWLRQPRDVEPHSFRRRLGQSSERMTKQGSPGRKQSSWRQKPSCFKCG